MRSETLEVWYFTQRGLMLGLFLVPLAYARAVSDAPLQQWGLLLLGFALGLRIWAGFHVGAHTNGSSPDGSDCLAITGPYAVSRHPIYLANLSACAAALIYANCLPLSFALALLLLAILHHVALVRFEERWLSRRSPGEYASYAAAVPRWLGLSFPWRRALVPGFRPFRLAMTAQLPNCLNAAAPLLILWLLAQL